MREILLSFIIAFCIGSVAYAQNIQLDEESKTICNQVILNIYYDILKEKNNFKELRAFGEKVVYKNPLDIYTLVYRYTTPKDNIGKNSYEFAITITRLDDPMFKEEQGYFSFAFPVLGVKFAGFFKNNLYGASYDILKSINKFVTLLADHQQKYLPLQLTLLPVKEVFKINERIEFEVILTNVSKKNFLVKSFGTESLFFIFNNKTWGAKQLNTLGKIFRGGESVVLKPDESIRMRFRGESFKIPKEFEIFCSYRLAIDGVEPSGRLKVKVEE